MRKIITILFGSYIFLACGGCSNENDTTISLVMNNLNLYNYSLIIKADHDISQSCNDQGGTSSSSLSIVNKRICAIPLIWDEISYEINKNTDYRQDLQFVIKLNNETISRVSPFLEINTNRYYIVRLKPSDDGSLDPYIWYEWNPKYMKILNGNGTLTINVELVREFTNTGFNTIINPDMDGNLVPISHPDDISDF